MFTESTHWDFGCRSFVFRHAFLRVNIFPPALPSAYVSIFIFRPFPLFVWYFFLLVLQILLCSLSMFCVWVLYIFRQDSFFLNLLKWYYFVFWILFWLFYDILAVHGGFCQVEASHLFVAQTINLFCVLAFRGALHLLQDYTNTQFSSSTFSCKKQIYKSFKSLQFRYLLGTRHIFFEARSHYVVLARLELNRWTRLILNS